MSFLTLFTGGKKCLQKPVIWCMVPEIRSATDKFFFVILDHFFPFYPSNNPKNQNFEKMKKIAGDIIILHMWTIYDNHMIYGSCDGHNFLSFWTAFCPFTPLTTRKIKILKNWKKSLKISAFYNSVPKIMIICYTVPEIWCMTDVIIFHFGPFFALLPPNSPKN